MTSYSFRAYGTPTPQGSKIPGVSKSGKKFVREQAGQRLKDWRKDIVVVAWIARRLSEDGLAIDGVAWIPTIPKQVPCAVTLHFYMPLVKSTKREYPSVQPDLDKLVRAVLDAMQQAGVFTNDGQVVEVHATKSYETAMHKPGVEVSVSSIE